MNIHSISLEEFRAIDRAFVLDLVDIYRKQRDLAESREICLSKLFKFAH